MVVIRPFQYTLAHFNNNINSNNNNNNNVTLCDVSVIIDYDRLDCNRIDIMECIVVSWYTIEQSYTNEHTVI